MTENQITEWLSANTIEPSEYGLISNLEWLIKEKLRIEKSTGKRCAVKFKKFEESGSIKISLFYMTV